MPSAEQRYREAVKAYLDRKPQVGAEYRERIKRYLVEEIYPNLERANLALNVKKMGDREVYEVYRSTTGGTVVKKIYVVGVFRQFLKVNGVYTTSLRVPKPIPRRPRATVQDFLKVHNEMVRWGTFVSTRRAAQLLLSSLSVRNIGAWKMGPEDIAPTKITVLDKGRLDGKPREIEITPSIYDQFSQYLDARQEAIMGVLRENPSHPIPQKLLIWKRKRTMGDLAYDTVSAEIRAAGRLCGVVMSEHRLRRMVSREMMEVCKDEDDVKAAMDTVGIVDRELFMVYAGERADKKAAVIAAVEQNRKRLIA